ncbi:MULTISPECIES: DUF2797 domain-containing protein [unclassified Francisella]|uniref:DUF2797 domain-containing protein n=1 Tax=unclassified Francisella TaxID=2610885 RepID=UPI002E38110B|nr:MULTISPECIES: DUF2797 domain-containing protein [unclassified Francisella]MED7820091.1 DUF2797 domain-containing protein [Francisella sp. 19S2-4]MED7830911.1 DUF2797 domain-containing protein [Francisella sp. 19S2-10]
MNKIINLHKMNTSLDEENNARYQLEDICMNDYIGKNLKIEFLDEINCVSCGAKTKKSYSQGHCFMCMRRLPECDICIVKPELCHFAAGTCRDSNWGEEHCMKTHIVYLANTGDTKVGITKLKNIPSRWIDQGASQAIPIFAVESRLISGLVEVAIKDHISDKTNWRKMLQGNPDNSVDFVTLRDNLIQKSTDKISQIKAKYGENSVEPVEGNIQDISYPILEYPTKIKSFNLDKDPIIDAKLMGIKGQYLIFDTGVINIRKFSGYKCNISGCL